MKALISSTALAILLAIPSVASAEITLSYGATLTSRYLANGIEQTTGAAFQPWLEAGYSGFYLGVWASNTAASIVGSDYEIDLYAGYRNEVGKFSYDLGYSRYYYTSPGVDCCGEWILSLGYGVTDTVAVGTRFAYDPVTEVLNSRLTADVAITDQIGLAAQYGSINKGGHDYWSLGASYALSDNFSVTASYNDTSITKALGVLSLDMSF